MERRSNRWLNKQALSVSEGQYEGYSIKFDLSFKEGGSGLETKIKADAEQYEGYDIGILYKRGIPRPILAYLP